MIQRFYLFFSAELQWQEWGRYTLSLNAVVKAVDFGVAQFRTSAWLGIVVAGPDGGCHERICHQAWGRCGIWTPIVFGQESEFTRKLDC